MGLDFFLLRLDLREMVFTLNERVEIVLLFVQSRTYQVTTIPFEKIHPKHTVSRTGVANMFKKLQRTRSVVNNNKVGRPSVEDLVEGEVFAVKPQQSGRAVDRNHN